MPYDKIPYPHDYWEPDEPETTKHYCERCDRELPEDFEWHPFAYNLCDECRERLGYDEDDEEDYEGEGYEL